MKVTTLCWCIFSAMVFNTFFKKTVNSVLCQFFFLIWQGFITESLDKLKEIKQQILHKEWSIICDYYTLYSLPGFSLAKSLQLILEISATYRLVGYLLSDNWLICRLCTQCMISKSDVKSVPCNGVFLLAHGYFKTFIIFKTII